jgi:hypothetical protein
MWKSPWTEDLILPSGAVITRCRHCNELVFQGELCTTDEERIECPSRRLLEEVAGAA